MDASIIIRTYNEAVWLPSVFRLLEEQQGASFEVIVVDSGSTDDTVEIAKRHSARIVHIAKADFSFGRSLNVGCIAAEGDVLVFLSGHCLPIGERWLANLIAPVKDGACVYSYGRQVAHPDITKYSERQIFEKFFPATSRGPSVDIACNNANSALSRTIWLQNRFDESLTGLEDMELAKRLVGLGYLIGYVAEAPVTHIHEESWTRVKIRYERESIALQRIIPEIQMSLIDAARYCLSAIGHDLMLARRDGVLLKSAHEVAMFRTMQYWGAYRGNHEHRKLSRSMKEEYYYPRRLPSEDEKQAAHAEASRPEAAHALKIKG